ncbi:DNA mismatch repair endonuclease MutL [Geovibrio thiophilus]|uniref:DNA mismatch repair protein MutL n=1 Tax=Geovibrio thiophilus TaxID=139438 RepID=A0A410JXH2_9BACT|nr:DNA mismatch repair endonuclease MutL [Geovibrio thiophilus]QAR32886.1 DNA mismatch repair endonuclease MutL [Geovibrio thiophilus]
MMNEIIRLPESVSNKVAAGEVVEKPLNAVKELMENSADAGADSISVEIKEGGLSLIRITDNGRGILKEDLPAAVERFATSKIRDIEDIYSIHSYGFRGEALAAISSVSDFSIMSARNGEGNELRMRFGVPEPLRPAPSVQGTCVTVKDLFRNVPARLKFFGSPQGLEREIIKFVKQFAVFTDGVAVRVKSNSKEVFSAGRDESFLQKAKTALGVDDLAYGEKEYSGVSVRMAASLPTVQRYRRDAMIVAVNGRVVKDAAVVQAVVQAYHRLIPENRYPACAVEIKVRPEDVDVNVHPAKAVVKMLNSRDIFGMVHDCVRDTLDSQKNAPAEEESAVNVIPDWFGGEAHEPKEYFVAEARPSFDISSVMETVQEKPAYSNTYRDHPSIQKSVYEQRPFRIIGQAFDSLIICEMNGSVFFVDQHVAHERVLYEKFLNEKNVNIPSIVLFEPMVIEADTEEIKAAEENAEDLAAFGFGLETFGTDSIKIVRVPADILKRNIEKEIREMLSEMVECSKGRQEDSRILTMSCKCAVKAGDKLTFPEMDRIMADLLQTSNPHTCPHGRPITYSIDKETLFRKFNR